MRKEWHDGMGVYEDEAETRWTDDMLLSFLSGVNEEGLQHRREIDALFWQIDMVPRQTARDEAARDTSWFTKGDP